MHYCLDGGVHCRRTRAIRCSLTATKVLSLKPSPTLKLSPSLSGYPFYPFFIPTNPNQTLINANEGVNFASTKQISLSTQNGTGGLLNIPFVGGGFDGTKIKTTQMTVDYYSGPRFSD